MHNGEATALSKTQNRKLNRIARKDRSPTKMIAIRFRSTTPTRKSKYNKTYFQYAGEKSAQDCTGSKTAFQE